MEQKALDSVKSELRSVLVSSKSGCTVDMLGREYYSLMGCRIPFKQFGYRTLLEFLKSIPDTILINGSNESALVTLIVNSKIEHIKNLVQNQKSKRKAGHPSKPYRQYQQRYPRRRNDYRTQYVPALNAIKNKQINYSQRSSNFHPSTASKTPYFNSYAPNIKESNLPISQTKQIEKHWDTCSNNAPNRREELLLESKENIIANSQSMISNFTTKKSELFDIPAKIEQNLKTLISSYSNGIVVSELSKLYKLQFYQELNYENLGCTSAVELCTALPDIFHCVRPSKHGSCMIFDASRDIPEEVLKNYKKEVEDNAIPLLDKTSQSPDKAELFLDMYHSKDLYRADSLGPNDIISEMSSPFKVNGRYNITVSETYDPSKFWFQYNHEDFYVKLNDVMDDMGQFYYEKKKKYAIPPGALAPGLYCAAPFLHSYHRARITQVLPSGRVKLFYVDYGTVNVMEANLIRFLHRDFAKLPQQAFRGKLDYIVPFGLRYWPLGIVSKFIKFTQQKSLIGFITDLDSKEGIHGMVLYDPEEKLYINENFVVKGFAEVNKYPEPDALFMHPKFQFLEEGLVFSHVDLLRLSSAGYEHSDILPDDLKLRISKYNNDKNDNTIIIINYATDLKRFYEAKTEDERFNVFNTTYKNMTEDPYYKTDDTLSIEVNGNCEDQSLMANDSSEKNGNDIKMHEILEIEEIRYYVNVILFGELEFHIVYHNGSMYVILGEVVDLLTEFDSVCEMEEVLKEKKVYFNYLVLSGEKDYDILREIAEFDINLIIPITPQNIASYKLKVLKLESLPILLYTLDLEYNYAQAWVEECLQAVNATSNVS